MSWTGKSKTRVCVRLDIDRPLNDDRVFISIKQSMESAFADHECQVTAVLLFVDSSTGSMLQGMNIYNYLISLKGEHKLTIYSYVVNAVGASYLILQSSDAIYATDMSIIGTGNETTIINEAVTTNISCNDIDHLCIHSQTHVTAIARNRGIKPDDKTIKSSGRTDRWFNDLIIKPFIVSNKNDAVSAHYIDIIVPTFEDLINKLKGPPIELAIR